MISFGVWITTVALILLGEQRILKLWWHYNPTSARACFCFCVHKSSACQEKKTDFRGSQTKGSLREGAPDEVGWGRARYDRISTNSKLRGLLPSRYRVPPSSRRKAMLPPDSASKKCNTLYLAGQGVWKKDREFSCSLSFCCRGDSRIARLIFLTFLLL